MKAILTFMDQALEVVDQEDFDFARLRSLDVKDEIAKAHLYPENEWEKFDELETTIQNEISALKRAA